MIIDIFERKCHTVSHEEIYCSAYLNTHGIRRCLLIDDVSAVHGPYKYEVDGNSYSVIIDGKCKSFSHSTSTIIYPPVSEIYFEETSADVYQMDQIERDILSSMLMLVEKRTIPHDFLSDKFLDAGFNEIEQKNMACYSVLMNLEDYQKHVDGKSKCVDGNSLWTADLWTIPEIPSGNVIVLPKPEIAGVLTLEKDWSEKGWSRKDSNLYSAKFGMTIQAGNIVRLVSEKS